MRIAFLGTAEFAVPVLEKLLEFHSPGGNYEVVGVVTGPDKPAGRGRKLLPTPVKICAEKNVLPILTPTRFKDPDFLRAYSVWKPDVAIVVAFKILPPEVFDLPPLGTLNIHPSLLPAYRGPAPLNWALINGDTETGVSIIRISSKVDAGGVLLQKRVAISPNETAGDLSDRLAPLGGEMVLETLAGIENKSVSPIPQDESMVTRAPKLAKTDGELDWLKSAEDIHNLVRGVSPWPGAYTNLQEDSLKLFGSRLTNGTGKPGEILYTGKDLVIACGEGAVSFTGVQRQGKRKMSVPDFIRGFSLSIGDTLGKS